MKGNLGASEWAVGLIFSLVFVCVSYVAARDLFYALETAAYDRSMRLSFRQPNTDIAVIAIDDRSIQSIGRWPWSRDILASLIERLHEGGARLVASTIFTGEPEVDPGYDSIRELQQFYRDSSLAAASSASLDQGADSGVAGDLRLLSKRLDEALQALDYDRRLAESLTRAGNVVLPMGLELGKPLGRPRSPPADYVLASVLTHVPAEDRPPAISAEEISPPIPPLGEAALGLGHLGVVLDRDGAARFEPLVARYYQYYFPSLALVVAMHALNLDTDAIELDAQEIRVGGLAIPTTRDLRMYSYFYPERADRPAFAVESFYDVFTGRVAPEAFHDKIVLIGAAAAGLGDWVKTPVHTSAPPVTVLANTVSALLEEHFYVRPRWAPAAEAGVVALLALYLMFVLPRLRAGLAALVSVALGVILLGVEFVALNAHSAWLQLVIPASLLASGHLVITVKRFRITEGLKLRADLEGAESNKMLGLAFQGQGQLDMAFEKFRRCPLDGAMMELLYNLGLDYERKRQFNKAGAVYGYMAEHDPGYRDLASRLQRSQTLEETMMFGGPGRDNTAAALSTNGLAKPSLGRYVLEKELGKGAMGTVYQGRDPKINRVVAIKTIPLSEEFEPGEIEAVKAQFFREAESAGRLNHPDIVTIYDAGEEQDLAYIAMEFVTGGHLNTHTSAGQLLPAERVLDLAARVAEALDFAHREGVVHRDIKPANIMYNLETDQLKITDFGIARIVDTNRTKTGIVLGTPSYMAPEQLAGKNVTGRSDLFSLGVTLYQLLTGQLPFRADSMAALMYKIASEPPSPMRALRPDLPGCVESVIGKALEKDPQRRYATGAAMATDIRQCRTVREQDKVTG